MWERGAVDRDMWLRATAMVAVIDDVFSASAEDIRAAMSEDDEGGAIEQQRDQAR